MDEWLSEWLIEWLSEWLSEGLSEWLSEWLSAAAVLRHVLPGTPITSVRRIRSGPRCAAFRKIWDARGADEAFAELSPRRSQEKELELKKTTTPRENIRKEGRPPQEVTL